MQKIRHYRPDELILVPVTIRHGDGRMARALMTLVDEGRA